MNILTKKVADLPLEFLWCQWVELNHRPADYDSDALPTELQRQVMDTDGIRTRDLFSANEAFFQLNY